MHTAVDVPLLVAPVAVVVGARDEEVHVAWRGGGGVGGATTINPTAHAPCSKLNFWNGFALLGSAGPPFAGPTFPSSDVTFQLRWSDFDSGIF